MATTDDKPASGAAPASEVKEETVEKKSTDAAPANGTPKENGSTEEAAKTAEVKSEAASGDESKPSGDAANGTTEEKKKEQTPRIRFTNAAKRRYKWLINQGYEREEAAKLANDPAKANEIREKIDGAQKAAASSNGSLKRTRSDGPNGPPSKLAKPTVKKSIRMAVTTTDFPASTFTSDQASKVKNAILKQMLQQKDSTQKPHFQDCVFVGGYLLVNCSDQATVKWLQHTVPKLEPWKGVSLKTTSEKSLSKSDVFIGFFTDSRQDSNKDILNFIECQNDGISTSKWAVLGRKEVPKKQTIELTFTVDQASGKTIQKLGYELNYKFNKIKIRKKNIETSVPAEKGRTNIPTNRNLSQRRTTSSSFVPIWDNNLPSRNSNRNAGNFKRTYSPPRRNNRGGDQFNRYGGNSSRSGGNSNRSGGNQYGGNSYGGSGGGGGFQSNNRLPSLVDSLYDQLLRNVSRISTNVGGGGGNQGFSGGSNRGQGGFGSGRSGFF